MINKQNIVYSVYKEYTKIPLSMVTSIIEQYNQAIISALSDGEDVNIGGFGKFKSLDRAKKSVRNPRTGERMTVPATRVARFTPAKYLKRRVASK